MKYLLSKSNDPYFNLAVEEYIIKNLNQDILYIYRNKPSVIIGKNQNPLIEVKPSYLKENNILLVRRFSGGGAVYHDLGNVNYSFILKDKASDLFNFLKYSQPIINFLKSEYNLDVQFGGRNDLQIDNYKISGAAQFVQGNNLIHHGTLMVNLDTGNIDKILTPNYQKIKSKGVKSVSAHVANITKFLNTPINIDQFVDKLISYISDEEEINLSLEEINNIQNIADQKKKAIEFVINNSKIYDYQLNEYIPGFGTLQIYFNLDQEEKIKEFEIFGEYFSKYNTKDLKKYFLNQKYNQETLKIVIDNIDNFSEYFHNLSKEKLLNLIMLK